MLVILPTYRRLRALPTVMRSIYSCSLPNLQCRPRLVVVNNYPGNAQNVGEIVRQVSSQDRRALKWETNVLLRGKSLAPADNWFGALERFASNGEIATLHGDDDVMLPWGLTDRCAAQSAQSADLVLARVGGGVTFLENGKLLLSWPVPSRASGPSAIVSFSEVEEYAPAHIGNVFVRYSDRIGSAIQKARDWTEQLDWMDYSSRTVIFPYLLTIACSVLGLRIAALQEVCQLRGCELGDKVRAPFGVPGWNPGFACLVAWLILSNEELGPIKALERSRKSYAEEAARWYLTYFLDPRISGTVLRTTLLRAKLSIRTRHILAGIRKLIPHWLGLNNARTRIRVLAGEAQSTDDFLAALAAQRCASK